MVQKIVWSAEAVKNVAEIERFIKKDSPFYAERIARQIYEKTSVLLKHPEIGMVVYEEERIKFRRILCKSYRILYCIKEDIVFIVAVFHQSKEFPESFHNDNLFQ